MPLYVKDSGAYKTVVAIYTRVGGVWKSASGLYTRVGGVWKTGHTSSFDVDLDTALATGDCTGAFCVATTNPVTATPDGGFAPFTYEWEFVSGDVGVHPNSPNSQTTTFWGDQTGSGISAVYRCKVTDFVGVISYSSNVSVELSFFPE